MEEEDWDKEENEKQAKKEPDTSTSNSSNEPGDRGRGRGVSRGRLSRGSGTNYSSNTPGHGKERGGFESRGRGGLESRGRGGFESRGRGGLESRGRGGLESRGRGGLESRGRGGFENRGRGGLESRGRGGFENRGRGGPRGLGSSTDFNKTNEELNDKSNDEVKFVRNRGRGRSLRGKDNLNKTNERANNPEKHNSDEEDNSKQNDETRVSRGLTPTRGARGRTRSSSGRFAGSPSREEFQPRGRGRGRGHGRALISRSDGEESEDGEERKSQRGRGRGRLSLNRSKSFRGASQGHGMMRGGMMRGGRGRGRGGTGKPGEEAWKPPEKYIPPEPTEDEDVMFHSGIATGIHFNNYDTIGVNVTGEKPPQPIMSFETAGLRNTLLENIKKSEYQKPTPVQKNSIPIVAEGRDLMACAQTGSGKTAAYLIPVINDLLGWNGTLVTGNCVEPVAVILSPTRELAIQIFQEARKFAHGSAMKIALIYGGTVVQHQLNQIKRGCHILVAVPGRLEAFLKAGHIKLSSVKYIVLDEADRMLELGFKDAVTRILTHETIPKLGIRRTLMFSATFPQEIQELASTHLCNYLFLAVGEVGGACSDVQQLFHKVAKFDKREKLLTILRTETKKDELTLVFVGMKRHADFLAVYLCENELQTTSIHGARYQSQREEALSDFKSGVRPILIATAVAARGLDIKNVSHVINYDLPGTIEEYVHRIGRTGRVGNCGKSTSFYDPSVDRSLSKSLVKVLKQANQPVPDFLESDAADSRIQQTSVDEFAGTDIRTATVGEAGSSA